MLKHLFGDQKGQYIIFIISLVCLIIDISISNIADLISKEVTSHYGIVTFTALSVISLFGFYYMYRYLNKTHSRSGLFFGKAWHRKILSITFYGIILLNCILIFEVLVLHGYDANLLIALITLSYGVAFVLFAVLAKRFFGWFASRRSIVVILYAAATAIMSFNMITSLIEFNAVIYSNESKGFYPTNSSFVTASTPVNFTRPFPVDSPADIISNAQFYSVDIYFVLSWLATGLFLYHYSARIGKIKYWTLISIIVFYYFYYYYSLWEGVLPISSMDESSIPIILVNTYSLTTGGIIFGIGFFLMAKSVRTMTPIRDYLVFCGMGFTLFFNCANATVYQNPYPPFGILNVSYVSLSSLFITVGLTFAAFSVSKDVELRRNIIQSTKNNYNPIAKIASAQETLRLKEKIVHIIDHNKEVIEQADGVSSSLTDEEIANMVDNVMQEIRKKKDKV